MQRNAMSAARVILAAVPLYAQSLAGRVGVNVVFHRGTTAATDGKDLYLPQIPLPKSDDDVEAANRLRVLMMGFVAHECGHIRHTDFSVETGSEQVHTFVNAIEDPRQENASINEYMGLRSMLDEMTESLIGVPEFYTVLQEGEPPMWLLSAYTMYQLRAELRGQPKFGELALQSRPAMVATFGEGFVNRLDVICTLSGPKLRSTADSHAMAKEILAAMAEEQKKQEEKARSESDSEENEAGDGQDSQDGQTSGQQGSGNGDQQPGQGDGQNGDDQGDGGDEAGDGNEGTSTDGQQSSDGQQQGQRQKNGGQQGGGNGAGGDVDGNAHQQGSSGSEPSAKQIASALKDASEDAVNGLKDLGDLAQKQIQAEIGDIASKGVAGYIGDDRNAEIDPQASTARRPTPRGTFDTNQALLYSGQLRGAMQNELKAMQRRRDHESIRGTTLNQKTLHRTSTGDRRLFLRVDDRKELNTAIMVLLDTSGSMSEHGRIQLAQQASFTVATALNGLTGVSTAVATFPTYEVILRFGERAARQADYFAMGTQGTTPMAEGVLWSVRQLLRRREDRKILMVVTDGQPDNPATARAQILAAEHHGIETMGIGIQLPTVSQLFDKSGVINSLSELTPMMMSMIRGTLRSQLMAA